jgi:hypothetical protein
LIVSWSFSPDKIDRGEPLVVTDMLPAPEAYDDHALAIDHYNGRFGTIDKSYFSILRSGEPVYYSQGENGSICRLWRAG